jgi:hypothetical protein
MVEMVFYPFPGLHIGRCKSFSNYFHSDHPQSATHLSG